MIDLVAVLGPTASGKSGLAEHLARKFGGELINSDASAVYQELSVGVTKPDLSIREEIPHHLIDVATLERGYDMSDFLDASVAAVEEIAGRGKLPIVVGGTGLYARALLDGYQPPQIEVPEVVKQRVRTLELESALAELLELDPAAHARIDQKNPRRVQRALELAISAGGPVKPAERKPRPGWRILRFYLLPDRPILAQRISQRTAQMWAPWLEEVDLLEEKGLLRWLELRKPIGYEAVLAFKRGQMSRTEAMELIVRQTVKLAKKQRTWLKKETDHPYSHHFILERDEQWEEIPRVAGERLREFLGAEPR